MWGWVVTDAASPLYLGAEKGSNNTAEMCAVAEAFLWLLEGRRKGPLT